MRPSFFLETPLIARCQRRQPQNPLHWPFKGKKLFRAKTLLHETPSAAPHAFVQLFNDQRSQAPPKGKEESAHSRDPSLPSFLEKGSLSGPPQAPKGVVGTKEKRRCLQERRGGGVYIGWGRRVLALVGQLRISQVSHFAVTVIGRGGAQKGSHGLITARPGRSIQSQRWPAHPQHQRSRPHPSAPAFSHPLG